MPTLSLDELKKAFLRAAWLEQADECALAALIQEHLPADVQYRVHVAEQPTFVAPLHGMNEARWYEPLPRVPPERLRYFSPVALASSFTQTILDRMKALDEAEYRFDEFASSRQLGEGQFRVVRNSATMLKFVAPSLPSAWSEAQARHLLSLEQWTAAVTGFAFVVS